MNRFVASTWLLVVVIPACGGSDGKTVKDTAGRTCTIPSGGSMTLSCDQAPQPVGGCSGGATACFVQGLDDTTTPTHIGAAAVCAACCTGNSSTSSQGDCAAIVCTTLADCPNGSTRCESGGCY